MGLGGWLDRIGLNLSHRGVAIVMHSGVNRVGVRSWVELGSDVGLGRECVCVHVGGSKHKHMCLNLSQVVLMCLDMKKTTCVSICPMLSQVVSIVSHVVSICLSLCQLRVFLFFQNLSQFVPICPNLSQFVSICHNLSQFVPICPNFVPMLSQFCHNFVSI